MGSPATACLKNGSSSEDYPGRICLQFCLEIWHHVPLFISNENVKIKECLRSQLFYLLKTANLSLAWLRRMPPPADAAHGLSTGHTTRLSAGGGVSTLIGHCLPPVDKRCTFSHRPHEGVLGAAGVWVWPCRRSCGDLQAL